MINFPCKTKTQNIDRAIVGPLWFIGIKNHRNRKNVGIKWHDMWNPIGTKNAETSYTSCLVAAQEKCRNFSWS